MNKVFFAGMAERFKAMHLRCIDESLTGSNPVPSKEYFIKKPRFL